MSNITSCYKIRNKEGLFSTGGESPYWKKKGKVWPSKQAIMAHLALFVTSKYGYKSPKVPYKDSDEIVEFVISTEEGSRLSIQDELKRLEANRFEKDVKQEAKWAKDKLERAKKDLEKAQDALNKLTNK